MNGKPEFVLCRSGFLSDYWGFLSASLKTAATSVLFISSFLLSTAVSAAPNINEFLDYLAIPKAEQKLIFQGDMITKGLEETSDSEIAVGFAFLLPKPPEQLGHIFVDGSKMEISPQMVY